MEQRMQKGLTRKVQCLRVANLIEAVHDGRFSYFVYKNVPL